LLPPPQLPTQPARAACSQSSNQKRFRAVFFSSHALSLVRLGKSSRFFRHRRRPVETLSSSASVSRVDPHRAISSNLCSRSLGCISSSSSLDKRKETPRVPAHTARHVRVNPARRDHAHTRASTAAALRASVASKCCQQVLHRRGRGGGGRAPSELPYAHHRLVAVTRVRRAAVLQQLRHERR
jgi:hypothetical protein